MSNTNYAFQLVIFRCSSLLSGVLQARLGDAQLRRVETAWRPCLRDVQHYRGCHGESCTHVLYLVVSQLVLDVVNAQYAAA